MTAMTPDQLTQAKAQVAAAKVAAVQPLIDALSGANGTALKALAATAMAALDQTDAIYQPVQSIANILNLSANNLTIKLTPLQTVAAEATA